MAPGETSRVGDRGEPGSTLDTVAAKRKCRGGEKPKRGAKGSKARKGRNVVPAESDPAPDADLDRDATEGDLEGDLNPGVGDPGSNQGDLPSLTPKQREFANYLVSDAERCGWKAAWKAGYCGGDPDLPYPDDDRKRKTLAQTASKTVAKPAVAAYIAELDARATAAFMAGPQGEVIREHVAAREAQQHEAEKLAALNLDVITAIALHDPRDLVQWDQTSITIADSKQLEYHQAILLKEVRHEDVFHKDGSTSHITTVKLADRAPYVKLLEQRLGKLAPIKHEVSGPGGGPIEAEIGVAVAPAAEQLDECAMELLGVVPASVSEAEAGLAPDEVVAVIKGWSADPDPHVFQPWELFEEEHLGETMARYLGDDG